MEAKMGRIIAVANQKGGVAKTTTTVNLSACLAGLGKKVLMVDSDPQGNATSGIGIQKYDLSECYYDVLINDENIGSLITETQVPGLDVVPATLQLAGAEVELVQKQKREYLAKKALDKVKHRYDYILMDCPPSLGLLTINALTAADSYLIPVQAEYYALEGLTLLLRTIESIRKSSNQALRLEGVLLTMYDSRTNLSNQVEDEVQAYFRDKLYQTRIPKNVKLAEAPSYGLPICKYDKNSKGCEAYLSLAKEVINRG
jgi:chromosome partitioning protein